MRVGKKPNVVEAKKTRSCVVRLEKVHQNPSSPVSPTLQESKQQRTNRNNRLSITSMGATPKGRKGVTPQQEEKPFKGPIKKRPVGSSSSSFNTQTPQQKSSTTNMSNIRSNQKIKIIPRSNKSAPVSTPARDETPTPTVALGRSRRAIKPNPKYASEDLVTPKVVRNVALGSSGNRGGPSAQTGKQRKLSTSSDDFYNHNSDDDFETDNNEVEEDDDSHADEAYEAYEAQDSDFSDVEELPARTVKTRGRPKRKQESTSATIQQSTLKLSTHTPVSNIKRTTITNATSLRPAPSQLQQIRRSLASANAQRNVNLLAGSGTAQKRKLEDSQDLSDHESSYTVTRKQMLLTTSSGVKLKVPVKDSKVHVTSTPLTNKSRVLGMHKISATSTPQQTLNGGSKINSQISSSSRKIIEIPGQKSTTEHATRVSMKSLPNRQVTATNVNNNKSITSTTAQQQTPTTQTKMFAAKTSASSNRLRSGSPKPTSTQKDTQSNITTVQSSVTSSTQNVSNTSKKLPTINNSNRVGGDKTKSLMSLTSPTKTSFSSNATKTSATTKSFNTKTKSAPSVAAPSSTDKNITPEKTTEIQEDSPNSTMDFETMPTFTIVNVNDIINKKGDVLITKSKPSNKPTVIEFTESISLDDDEDDEEDDDDDVMPLQLPPAKKTVKLPTINNKKEFENKKSPMTRSNESLRKTSATQPNSAISSSSSSTPAPQILNHKLGLRKTRVTPKTTTLTLTQPDKPAPRILNSVVAKKTQPVKPMIANLDDSADESFPLSLDEDEEEETEDEVESKSFSNTLMGDKINEHHSSMEVDTEDTESQNTEEGDSMMQAASAAALTPKVNTLSTQRKRRPVGSSNTPTVVSNNKKRLTPAATKENSLAATNQQVNDAKSATITTLQRKNADKVVISKQGDKIIKKITCFETWYVINMPLEVKRHTVMKNQLEMPLIRLANNAKSIDLPTELWSCKVTLYELSPNTLAKSTLATYTGNLTDHNISEEDRAKYQPSCVMFRRSADTRISSRMPYDRAVIFKNKTFYTNIEGKNVRLIGAPSIINSEREVEILLEVVDALTLQSEFVEHVSLVQ